MNIGTKVRVDDKRNGKIVGAGWFLRHGQMESGLLIELDEGFYEPAGGYVSILVAHSDSVREIESSTYNEGMYEPSPVEAGYPTWRR